MTGNETRPGLPRAARSLYYAACCKGYAAARFVPVMAPASISDR